MARHRYTRELLAAAVASSYSIAEVLRVLGIRPAGGNHTHVSRRIKQFGIDTSHFLGQGRNRGESHRGGPTRTSASELLVVAPELSSRTSALRLRRALAEIGRPLQCELCGNPGLWKGSRLVLEVDHKNGLYNDNRPDNLRFLCPNCHSQTENFAGRANRVSEWAAPYGAVEISHVRSTTERSVVGPNVGQSVTRQT
jgi:hypothetical protein